MSSLPGSHQDCPALQDHQERADPGDPDVPGQLRHVPHPRQLPGGLPGADPEAGLKIQRVGILRLHILGGVL